jgi:predicted Holliday junction resolvase-like endonuclease
MLLDITVPQSTLVGWSVVAIILILIFIREFTIRTKKKYQDGEKQFQQKEQEIKAQYAQDKAVFEKTVAETQLKAKEWGMVEFEKFKQTELENARKIISENAIAAAKNLLAQWIAENEDRIRKDAANRSVRNVMGKVTEQLLPFSEAMSLFNPKDARFLGSPIDLIVFDGSEELKDEINIVFIEVKTGTSALSKRQRLIREAIENHRVYWKRVNMKDFGDDVNEALKLPG